MKFKTLFIALVSVLLFFSCDSDDQFETVEIAKPILMTKAEFRQSIEIIEPAPLNEVGKIYAYKNYIFITEPNKGIHIIDNTNPESPFISKFIKILHNEDISIKNDLLYADNAFDLVVFDISDINSITEVDRLEDIFNSFDYYQIDDSLVFDEIDYTGINYEEDIIIGWETETITRKIIEEPDYPDYLYAVEEASFDDVGQGGSLARFKIVKDFLYTVSSYEMFIFDIQNLENPSLVNTQNIGWGIETIFYADDYLYLGGERGMYIYGVNDPAFPEYISEFTHWEGCDPVVVDGNYAYLTLRGGNLCGQDESVLEVIDVSNKANPTLASRYTLENPYGLGFKENTLFVSDGTAGLKLFDKTDPINLKLTTEYTNINSKDLIPLENSLLMIGDTSLVQYKYTQNGIEEISTFALK